MHRLAVRRREAYLSTLAAHGVEDVVCLPGEFTFASGFAAGEIFLAGRSDDPTFVFAANDDMAAGVVAAAGRAGMRMPGDVSLADFDGRDDARKLWPPMTTVHQPIEAIGAAAGDILTSPTFRAGKGDQRLSGIAVHARFDGPAPSNR